MRKILGSLTLLLASALGHEVAHAEETCRDGDPDCPETSGQPRVINVSALVPLKELNRRPYSGVWFADLRYHEYELGLSVLSLNLKGRALTEDVEGSNTYVGITGSYYFPLLGFTPNLSLGLVPELHALLGGFYGGSSSSALDELSETKVGTALVLPAYLMARVGGQASRYGDWPVSFGAGVGISLVSFTAGEPVADSGTFAQPLMKFEAAYSSFKLGFSTGLGFHDNFKSPDATVRLSYRPTLFTLTLVTQPDPED